MSRGAPEFPNPLLPFAGAVPPAPDWFHAAVADAPQRSETVVQGAPIETLAWGQRGDPGLLLLHGNGAHADWYSFLGPLLAARGLRVVALSFSGMGRSGWRTQYAVAQWADEAQAVAEAAGLFDAAVPPLLAAHSFGGFVAMVAAARWGQRLAGTVIIDTPFTLASVQGERFRRHRGEQARSKRSHATLAAALARFRLLPPQGCAHPFIADHIARHGLKPVAGADGQPAWAWRLDPFLFRHFSFGQPVRELASARCPLVLVRGGRSRLVTAEMLAQAVARLPAGTRSAEVPDADHHVMVDQPLALVELLTQLRAEVV
jgi:pimeloyl-ACP methyl ester carboxylesterase